MVLAAKNTSYRLPDFICPGVEKCGTTTLYDVLQQNPAIGLSLHKEIHFFNSHWEKGLPWYAEKFSHCPVDCRIGEITPAYHRFDEVIPRLQATLSPELKIILMLREPRQRAFSHYVHDFARHQQFIDLLYKRYLVPCQYAPILEKYFDAFGQDNCLVLIFEEDVIANQQILMDKVCDFLQIPSVTVQAIHSNPSLLPVACRSPAYPSQLMLQGQSIRVPANSLVVSNGEVLLTHIHQGLSRQEQDQLIQHIQQAIAFIPALKSSIIFEQNVEQDLMRVEKLLGRRLEPWRKPLGDLHAKTADPLEFIPHG